MNVYIYVYKHIYICMYVYTYTHMYVQIYTSTYTHTQKFINLQYIPTKNHTSVCACGYVQFQ